MLINNWHQNLYKYFLYFSYIIFILSLFGVTILKTEYSTILNNIIKIYIAIVLIIRFNPLIHVKFDKNNAKFDREIAFSAGILLLLSVITLFASKIINC
jgi:hypothetical protein